MSKKKTIKRIYNVVVVLLLLAAIVYVFSRFTHPGNVEWTDDAQVHRQITPINTRVQGFIKEIRFEDYQYVHAGDTLVIIEDAEYRLQLAQAQAGVKGQKSGTAAVSASIGTTNAGVNVAAAGVTVANAGISEAKANLDHAKRELDRYQALLAKDAVTKQQYDAVKTQYDDAKSRLDVAQARVSQASSAKNATAVVKNEQSHRVNQSQAGESVAQAQLNLARLNLSYTVIIATCDGYMGRKDIHVGQLVQPGQELAKIIDDSQIWVIANYRETQLKNIKKGSEVTFTADAIPDVTFHGQVQIISDATGAAFSNAPVDNATGNFVKVEQRVPVRIILTKDNKAADLKRLRAGLNVETEVKY